jgi:hypothetical protein
MPATVLLAALAIDAPDLSDGTTRDDHRMVRMPFGVTKVCFCSEATDTGRYKPLPQSQGIKGRDRLWIYVEANEAVSTGGLLTFTVWQGERRAWSRRMADADLFDAWKLASHLPRLVTSSGSSSRSPTSRPATTP